MHSTKYSPLAFPLMKCDIHRTMQALPRISTAGLVATVFAGLAFCGQKTVSGLQSGIWEPSVYVVDGDVTVPRGLDLTLEPGVVVKFSGNHAFTIDGDLHTNGTAEKPVVFSSFADDEPGGDTNQDGIETGPMPLDWRGIEITDTASSSQLKHLQIRYSLEPLHCVSDVVRLDSLVLSGNSRNRIIVGKDTLRIAENVPFSKSPNPRIAKKEDWAPQKSVWFKSRAFAGSVAAVAAGTVIYLSVSGDGGASPAGNGGSIPDPPGPPANP